MAARKNTSRAKTAASGYSIGFMGCQHLGYSATGMRANKATRWNQRIVDGHYAHEATMRSMIEHGVAGVVDGGDLTHFNKPLPRDIEVANRVDDLRAAAGLWGIGNSGNHCAGGGSDISAMGVMHRPGLGMMAVYPDPTRGVGEGVGPFPGLYEIHTAATGTGMPDGLAIHVVSHYGLSKHLADVGIHVDPTPLPGHVNILIAHGTFETDERLFHCINPHGEERPIPHEWVARGWEATILSHYHTMGPVPGYDEGPNQVWYTGSALRRGFSDEAGERGWVKVTVNDAGDVTVEAVPLWQRPQIDLPRIDAAGLTVTEIDDLFRTNLAGIDLHDPASETLTGDGGVIVRQVVAGAGPVQRRGLNTLRGQHATVMSAAAHWTGLVFDRNDLAVRAQPGRRREYGRARIIDFAADLDGRFTRLAKSVPPRLVNPTHTQAMTWAHAISPQPDAPTGTGDSHTPQSGD